MSEQPVKLTPKENFIQGAKFCAVGASAGVVQIGSYALLSRFVFHDGAHDFGWSYFIALVLSVVWNFTINRRYTFQSANNVPKAMLLVFAFYLAFAPLSTLLGDALEKRWPRLEFLILFGIMFLNFILEFLYQRFVVFRKSLNTNDIAMKKKGAQEL